MYDNTAFYYVSKYNFKILFISYNYVLELLFYTKFTKITFIIRLSEICSPWVKDAIWK